MSISGSDFPGNGAVALHVNDDGHPAANTPTIVRKRVSSLKPSPENLQLYRHPDNDPEIDALAAALKKRAADGLPCDPLIITLDNYIVSGHRRYAALIRNGTKWVKCQIIPRRRDEFTENEYLTLLREYNRQRHKTAAEQVQEELVDIDPSAAHDRLCERRFKSIYAAELNGITIIDIEGHKKRFQISDQKSEHVKYVLQVLNDRRAYWPLSVRGVHYPLLNFDFIRGRVWNKDAQSWQELRYKNDQNSYDATSDLFTRLRLDGTVPWEAITDATRPVKKYRPFKGAREFVRQELEGLFCGYWRDLLQSQPNYIEVLVEKNTVYHMAARVTDKYQIPIRSGRGFNSIDPYHETYEDYIASGKEQLILIILSDYDPEGEEIPHVAGRTLRDDFGVEEHKLKIIKAGVTRKQIERFTLPQQNFAKETSSNYDRFLERNDGDDAVYELEALNPADMIRDLDNAVRSAIDIGLFNRELDTEREEAAYLEATHETVIERTRGIIG